MANKQSILHVCHGVFSQQTNASATYYLPKPFKMNINFYYAIKGEKMIPHKKLVQKQKYKPKKMLM